MRKKNCRNFDAIKRDHDSNMRVMLSDDIRLTT